METSILSLVLETLNIGGSIYKSHLDRSWAKDINKLEKKLWEESNKPFSEIDMVRFINLQKEIERKLKRLNTVLKLKGAGK